jgi:putative flippase GtrA
LLVSLIGGSLTVGAVLLALAAIVEARALAVAGVVCIVLALVVAERWTFHGTTSQWLVASLGLLLLLAVVAAVAAIVAGF